jgi:hypothetical protein
LNKYFLQFYILIVFLASISVKSQQDKVQMQVVLIPEQNVMRIHQQIQYFNHSNQEMHSLYLHDWNHAFSDKNSNLGKRFLENYSKKFFFASDKNRGFTNIHSILVNDISVLWKRESQSIDQIEIQLNQPIQPGDSLQLFFDYEVKIPNSRFTGYGFDKEHYQLRYWYLIPAVFDKGWQLMSHLDQNDLYQNPTDYDVTIEVPATYEVESNLLVQPLQNGKFRLTGKGILNFELAIQPEIPYLEIQTDTKLVCTNLNSIEISIDLKKDLLNRQLIFLKGYLGDFPQDKILVSQRDYENNPLYGFNQLPGFLRPFSDTFEWDLRMFQTLSKTYIDQSIVTHTRNDAWLREGLPHYLMLKYVEMNYPEQKLIGNISKIWGIKSYYLSKMRFNQRYVWAYQYVARQNHDQALNISTDSLTNYNRTIANRFKTALSLKYLEDFLGQEPVQKATQSYYTEGLKSHSNPNIFQKVLEKESGQDLNWFFDSYIHSDHNMDFSIHKMELTTDSIQISIKGGLSKMPISLYGLDKKNIISKYWFVQSDSLHSIKVPNQNEKKWMLNYESNIPEINLKNNWENSKSRWFDKPLQIRLVNDAEDPYHAQVFMEPKFFYNYYDGITLANTIHNKTFFKKNYEFSITPSYGFKSGSLTGSYALKYNKYFEDSQVNSLTAGFFGSYFHYKPELAYRTFTTFGQIFFKRRYLRSVQGKALNLFYTLVNKDRDTLSTLPADSYKYGVFHLNYIYSNPALINNFLFNADVEIGTQFTKLYSEVKFRKMTDSNQQFEARLFAGVFLKNNTTSDYFSYAVNRPNDYLFRYGYFGRSESSGFFSQQFIMNEGGIKSSMPVSFANQWLTTLNTSIGLWKWFEIYNDVGLVKNRDRSVYFIHDKGIRFNFVNNFLEVYFPLHSNNGWEISGPHYEEKIRFVLTTSFKDIFGYLKRGKM